MRLEGPAQRVTIFVGESDQHHHHPVYVEIVARVHRRGLSGATVLCGLSGFGATERIHTRTCSGSPTTGRSW